MGTGECSVSFHLSQVIARFESSQDCPRILTNKYGTKVTVRNLFGNLPVRVKRRGIQFESQEKVESVFEDLKRHLVALLLAWSKPVKLILTDTEKRRKCVLRQGRDSIPGHDPKDRSDLIPKLPFRIDWICLLLFHAGYIPQSSFRNWVTASARTAIITIRAAFSLQPAPTKRTQFVSFGLHPIAPLYSSKVLYDEVNRLFRLSSFGNTEADTDQSDSGLSRSREDESSMRDEHAIRELRCPGKGADRWPMFYIRIDVKPGERSARMGNAYEHSSEAAQILQKVLELLQALLHQFLEENKFQPRTRRPHLRSEQAETFVSALSPIGGSSGQTPAVHTAHPAGTRTTRSGTSGRGDGRGIRRLTRSRPFESWSRVKSGQRDGLEHMLSGLPTSKSTTTTLRCASTQSAAGQSHQSMIDLGRTALTEWQSQFSLSNDVELLLANLQDEASSSTEDARTLSDNECLTAAEEPLLIVNEGKENRLCIADEDETVMWTNPTTGAPVCINLRTGLMMLQSQHQGNIHGPDQVRDYSQGLGAVELTPVTKVTRLRRPIRKATNGEFRISENSFMGQLLSQNESAFFRQAEKPIPSMICDETQPMACHHGDAQQVATFYGAERTTNTGRLSKRALAKAKVIAQVDRKFVLIKMAMVQDDGHNCDDGSSKLPDEVALVLVDQHAADERCQVERLYQEMCEARTVRLPKPIHFEISAQEARLFRRCQKFLASWGFHYEMKTAASTREKATGSNGEDFERIVVAALPELIAERCRAEPSVLIDLLRTDIWARAEGGGVSIPDMHHDWLAKISTCPKAVVDMLNSRACRSAIMFNDELSVAECTALVVRLARCNFPFQCAHGRPSMVVLGKLGKAIEERVIDLRAGIDEENEKGFAEAFATWEGGLVGEE